MSESLILSVGLNVVLLIFIKFLLRKQENITEAYEKLREELK